MLLALGQLEREAKQRLAQPSGAPMGRKQFLRLLGGTATAIGLIVTAQSPALARSEHAQASAWVEANMQNLPRTYDEICKLAMPYRKAIHRVLSPQEKARAWVDHFQWYRATHPDLTAPHQQVVDRAIEVFRRGLAPRPGLEEDLRHLERTAKATLGLDEAGALLATLGAAEDMSAAQNCNCSTVSDHCGWLYDCGRQIRCTVIPNDCGTGWHYDCNGICY
ncbi:bacteriocin fulvocin C-related protein [Streptomyces sp. CA-252508]|uniref:bacteriocin fulvocin C-related protein n=1 Tax=Streptomyces sp. CA-252508 TaxID=3418946 RepID=UPI003D8A47B9